MSPQFVDFDADGHRDIVTATFDGSPYVAYGSEAGFSQPEVFQDSKGERVLLDQFWNYETEAWENAERGAAGGAGEGEHCISAVVFDWDADGDLDLILGEYKGGRLYLQLNEGEPGAPAYTGKNIPIEVGGEEHSVPGGMTAPQLVDWNRDGLMDLVVGGFGEVYQGDSTGGGVWLLDNVGAKGEPEFDSPLTIVGPEKKANGEEPTRPDAGLYAQAVDYDGDGDLDLLVGGYSWWSPPKPELTAEQEARADELEAQLGEDRAAQQAMIQEATEGAEDPAAAYGELRATEAFKALGEKIRAATEELESLRPKPQRGAAVWLYERVPATEG